MKPICQDMAAADKSFERRIIRVELPHDSAGVTAALRRAFAGAALHPAEGQFDALLRQLN